MNLFEKYFNKVLNETMTSGSVGMAQAPDAPTVTQFSGDTYAPEDARVPKILGDKKKKTRKKKKKAAVKKKKTRKKKKKLKEENFPIIKRSFPETVFLKGAN